MFHPLPTNPSASAVEVGLQRGELCVLLSATLFDPALKHRNHFGFVAQVAEIPALRRI
ncbi:hypothetical protein [Nocardia sp. CA-119907]|uniref:hypothetical protein n=1 Tax=Nocardia sp. CA-119907 TaxID=3239973 RepID=UPI003D95AF55